MGYSSRDTWQGIEPVNHPDVTSEEVREGRRGRESTGYIKVLHTVIIIIKMMTYDNNAMLRLLLSILTALSHSKSAS